MSDQDIRELEQKALGGDPAALMSWVKLQLRLIVPGNLQGEPKPLPAYPLARPGHFGQVTQLRMLTREVLVLRQMLVERGICLPAGYPDYNEDDLERANNVISDVASVLVSNQYSVISSEISITDISAISGHICSVDCSCSTQTS